MIDGLSLGGNNTVSNPGQPAAYHVVQSTAGASSLRLDFDAYAKDGAPFSNNSSMGLGTTGAGFGIAGWITDNHQWSFSPQLLGAGLDNTSYPRATRFQPRRQWNHDGSLEQP